MLLLSFVSCGLLSSSQEADINIDAGTAENQIDPSKTETIILSEFIIDLIGTDPASVADAYNIDSVVKNEDGSVSYYLTPQEKANLLAQMRSSFNAHLESFVNSTDYPFVKDIKINSDYNEVTITTTATEYLPSRDDLIAPSIYIPAITYVAFSQSVDTDLEDFIISFTVINDEDDALISEFVYPYDKSAPSASSSSSEESSESSESSDEQESASSEKELPDVSRGDDIP